MKTLQITTISILVLLFGIGNYQILTEKPTSRCGIVTSNFTELQNVKHGTRTEYYLQVQYGAITEIENVAAETFYRYKVGESICLIDTKKPTLLYMYTFLINVIGGTAIILIFTLCVILICLGKNPIKWYKG